MKSCIKINKGPKRVRNKISLPYSSSMKKMKRLSKLPSSASKKHIVISDILKDAEGSRSAKHHGA